MIRPYGYKGELKRLAESLNATGVLSNEYASDIFNMALAVYSEGYREGQRDTKQEEPTAREEATQ